MSVEPGLGGFGLCGFLLVVLECCARDERRG
jgi:hypothetical protein